MYQKCITPPLGKYVTLTNGTCSNKVTAGGMTIGKINDYIDYLRGGTIYVATAINENEEFCRFNNVDLHGSDCIMGFTLSGAVMKFQVSHSGNDTIISAPNYNKIGAGYWFWESQLFFSPSNSNA